MIPTNPDEREALAAEYVLGTLEAHIVKEIDEARTTDTAFNASIERWEQRFAPLLAIPPTETVPADLWQRIEASLDARVSAGGTPADSTIVPFRRPAAPRLWRGWALTASALAAGLAAFILLRPPPERLATVLLTNQDQPAWLVNARGGALELASINPQPVDPRRVLQLWALPRGATAPTSLGLIPAAGQFSITAGGVRPEPGMLIEITLEPPGGSTTGRPTGPILFIGRLAAANPS